MQKTYLSPHRFVRLAAHLLLLVTLATGCYSPTRRVYLPAGLALSLVPKPEPSNTPFRALKPTSTSTSTLTSTPWLPTSTPIPPTPTTTPNTPRPNIVFILTDDLDYASIPFMPHLKELVSDQGMTFSNYLINVSLCCPSRATTLTGMYAHNTHIMENTPPDGGFETFYQQGLEKTTIATGLQAAGYYTALIGKYLNGYPDGVQKNYIPPGWNEWYVPVDGEPYLEFNYRLNENGKIKSYGKRAKDYLTDVLSAHAVDFIQRNAASGQPFFMYLATYAPHGPSIPAPRHKNLFLDQVLPRSPSFNEKNVSDKPGYLQNLPRLGSAEIDNVQQLYIHRLQSVQAIDEMVQAVVDSLKAAGVLDNTYIFFTSDNGFHMGQHRLVPGKQSPYEVDIKVPFVVSGPGIPKGQVRSELVGNVDLSPTFASLGRIPPFTRFDGRSLLPLLSGAPAPPDWRQAYLLEHKGVLTEIEEGANLNAPGLRMSQILGTGILEPPDMGDLGAQPGNSIVIPKFAGLRTQDYLYVEYGTGEIELYDLNADPDEMDNLAQKANPQFLEMMSGWLNRLGTCSGETCWTAEQLPPELGGP